MADNYRVLVRLQFLNLKGGLGGIACRGCAFSSPFRMVHRPLSKAMSCGSLRKFQQPITLFGRVDFIKTRIFQIVF